MKYRILVAEDEASVLEGLLEALSGAGYEAAGVTAGEAAVRKLTEENWSLCILDVRLPDMSGFDVCRRVREAGTHLPVLFLTAFSDEANTVRGFEMGGDDYVAKPFRLRELLSRVEALLRRCAPREGEAAERRFLVSGDICLNLKNRKLEMGGEELLLTPKESQIAYLLMSKWPEAVSRDELVRTFLDKTGQYIENNTIRVHMSRLREKLGTYEGNNYVETVRGIGYRWNIPVRSAL